MTVCIAAFAAHEERICLVSDSKAAFGDFSADKAAIKHEHLGNGHIVLISGNDAVYALPAIHRANTQISQEKTRDSDRTAEILFAELRATLDSLIESSVLRRYGMTVRQFIEDGRKRFTEQVFYNICSRIDRQDLSLTFLIAGFDSRCQPHLRVVSANEPPHDFDSIGFAAIGSGAAAALASLSFAADHHGFGRFSDLHESAYHLLAAKFMAEAATDVGRDTFFLSLGMRETFLLHHLGTDAVRKSWLKNGAPRHSRPTIAILRDVLCPTDRFLDVDVLGRCLRYGSRTQKKFYSLLLKAQKETPLSSEEAARQLASLNLENERWPIREARKREGKSRSESNG